MTEQLKPCPFCGREAIIVWMNKYDASVGCRRCGIWTGQGSVEKEINSWNKRALLPDDRSAIELLKDVADLHKPQYPVALPDEKYLKRRAEILRAINEYLNKQEDEE